MSATNNLIFLKNTVKHLLNLPVFNLDAIQTKAFKKAYDRLSSHDRKAFHYFFWQTYGQYSGKLTNFKWAASAGMLLAILDKIVCQEGGTLRFIGMIAIGSFLGFMGGRRTSEFFFSGNYYTNLKRVNDAFIKMDKALELNSILLRLVKNETVGINSDNVTPPLLPEKSQLPVLSHNARRRR